MNDREVYIDKMKAKLDEWNADINKLQAKANGAEADMKQKYDQEIQHLKEQREEAADKLAELQKAGDGAWKDLKSGMEDAWNSLGKSVDSAFSRFK